MIKQDVESILIINSYFTKVNLESDFSKSDLVRKYMTKKINKTLTTRKQKSKISFTILFYLHSISFLLN